MWMMTQYGFYSVVSAHGEWAGATDPDLLMIRARARDHLERLQARFPALKPYAINVSGTNDYRYRLIVPKVVFSPLAAELVTELDYSNFKSRCHAKHPSGGYVSALHRVWSDMLGIQHDDAPAKSPGKKAKSVSAWVQEKLSFMHPGSGAYVREQLPDSILERTAEGVLEDERASYEYERRYEPQPEDGESGVPPHGLDDVLLIIDPTLGRKRGIQCVVWWPDDFEDSQVAYHEAVLSGKCPEIESPQFERRAWGAVPHRAAGSVYDYKTDPIGGQPAKPQPA